MSTNSDATARAWVDVDLAALIANAKTIAALSRSRLLPMIKANGYGLGAGPVARALESLDPWGYGVATPAEGGQLRTAGIARPIIVFTPFQPNQSEQYRQHDLRAVIGDLDGLRSWLATNGGPFHLEVDTGMARSGIRWDDAPAWDSARGLLSGAGSWEGAFTHFHSADSNSAATDQQWQRFQLLLGSLPHRPPTIHAANSAAALRGTAYAADLVRPGIFLYGGGAGGQSPLTVARLRGRVIGLRTVRAGDSVSYDATWTAERETVIATVSLGYADGVPRSLSNRGLVEIGGRLAPIVGRVTMDMLMVRPPEAVAVGDVATVYGGLVSLDTAAETARTISFELLTSLGARVDRRYADPT
jgi:alanine racemase